MAGSREKGDPCEQYRNGRMTPVLAAWVRPRTAGADGMDWSLCLYLADLF